MAINIDTLVHNEFGRSATGQLEKLISKPAGQVQSGVDSAITAVLDGFSVMAREESGRQTLYEAARYCDDGLIDDPAVFFGAKDQHAALADSNGVLGGLVGIGKRDSISQSVQSASGLSAADADMVTGYVTPGVLGVMKRQMLNGAVLDNSDGIGQMLLGETTTATVGGAAASVDHSVPQHASRQSHTQAAHSQTTHASASGSAGSASAGGAAVASASHGEGGDHSWLFRWMLPALLLGGLVLAGVNNCGVDNRAAPVAVVDESAEKLASMQTEADGLRGQLGTLTAERDEALSDRETAVAEIDRLKGELDTATASAGDTSELDAANAEIATLKEELAKPADTSELDAANAEIASLNEQLAKPTDTSDLDAANAEIAGLKAELAKPSDNSALTAPLTAQIAALKNQLANVPEPVDNSTEIMGLKKTVEDNELKFAQLESELGTVRTNRDELEASIAQLRAETSVAQDRSTELKDKLLNVAGAKNRLEAEIAGLQQSVTDGEAANAEKQGTLDDLTAQLDAAAAEKSELSAEQEKLQAQITGLNTELDALRTERDGLAESVAQLTGERDAAMADVETQSAKVTELNDTVTAANDAMKQQQEAASALEAERDGAMSQIEIIQANLNRAVDDASAKRKEAVGFQNEILSLTGGMESLEATVAENESALSKASADLDAAMKASDDLSQKLSDTEAELMALKAASEESEAKLAKVTKGRGAAIKTVTDLAGKLRTAESDRDSVTGEKEALEAQLAKVTTGRGAAINTVKDLVGKLRNAESERNALAGDKQGLESKIAESEAAAQAEKDQVTSLSVSLADQLAAAGLGNVSVSPVEDNMAVGITLGSSDLYGVGSASLNSQGIDTLETVGSIVGSYDDWRIDVEGHTDGQPIGGALREKYPSNWELSVARAAAAVRYLQSRTGISADKMSARGFGEHKPVASNETAEGREANRRIELILRRQN